jgi:hypothetical protein
MQTDRREAVEECSSSQEHESDSSGGSGDSGGIFLILLVGQTRYRSSNITKSAPQPISPEVTICLNLESYLHGRTLCLICFSILNLNPLDIDPGMIIIVQNRG